MKVLLKMTSWTGGGLQQYWDMDFDDFLDWMEALREVQKEDGK
ncbi:hypothetical protein AGMMS50296_6460 [Alphaproteobacteria bacterium]|nr:hypothetical protein AGMMS50296_6460 [Alphaproteobacteria bacterium]